MKQAAQPIVMHGTGRMASAVVEALEDSGDFVITATVGPVAPGWGLSAPHYSTLDELSDLPVLLIDFSLPDGTRAAAEWCARNGVALLSGVTGLPGDVVEVLESASTRVAVLWSPNLSLGVNLMAALARQAAAALGAETPVAIEDIHHQWKRDAPSGTALMLGEAIGSQWRGEGNITYSSVREGDAVGVHTISFELDGEEIELVHRAHNRNIYALGALAGGKWLLSQPPGLYSASDWLASRMSGSS